MRLVINKGPGPFKLSFYGTCMYATERGLHLYWRIGDEGELISIYDKDKTTSELFEDENIDKDIRLRFYTANGEWWNPIEHITRDDQILLDTYDIQEWTHPDAKLVIVEVDPEDLFETDGMGVDTMRVPYREE